MTLSVHAVVASTLTVVARANPLTAFLLGFLSHFALDAIPHWDYPLQLTSSSDMAGARQKIKQSSGIGKDIAKISLDAILGFVLVYLIFTPESASLSSVLMSSIFWSVMGSYLPDFLQFVYILVPRGPLVLLQKFHVNIAHAKRNFNSNHIIGPAMQVAVVLICFLIVSVFVGEEASATIWASTIE